MYIIRVAHLEVADERLGLLLGLLDEGLVGTDEGGVGLLGRGDELGNVGHGADEGDSGSEGWDAVSCEQEHALVFGKSRSS